MIYMTTQNLQQDILFEESDGFFTDGLVPLPPPFDLFID